VSGIGARAVLDVVLDSVHCLLVGKESRKGARAGLDVVLDSIHCLLVGKESRKGARTGLDVVLDSALGSILHSLIRQVSRIRARTVLDWLVSADVHLGLVRDHVSCSLLLGWNLVVFEKVVTFSLGCKFVTEEVVFLSLR